MPDYLFAVTRPLKGATILWPLKSLSALIILFIFFNFNAKGQKGGALSHAVPEAEGVSSAGIDSFLNAAAISKHEFHSFMFLRHGKVIAQGWWNPYGPQLKHSLYSTSKSFTSTAIGFAVTEKLLAVQDKVISFFPESLPDSISPYLKQLTVKDLLTMSAGQTPDPTTVIPFAPGSWAKAFLALNIVHQPGSTFLYNTMGTYMLSAIIQKVTGQKEIDYLTPRLFKPLGITGMDWEVNEGGINTGGWGLRLKTEDLAKMGQLYLQKGMWQGKQLIPAAWIEEATTYKIDQAPGVAQSKRDSSDWMQGYCYQFWRCRHNAFRADGAFGQYIIVMPDKDAVIAITSESPDMQGELNLVWKYLLPAMHDEILPKNETASGALQKHLEKLSLLPLKNSGAGGNLSPLPSRKTFNLQPNDLKLNSVSFHMNGDTCQVILKRESAIYKFNFESGKWLIGKTGMQGPGLLVKAKEDFAYLDPYQIAGSYQWKNAQTLILKLRYIESPHSETITFTFTGDKLTGDVNYSEDYGKKQTALIGDLSK